MQTKLPPRRLAAILAMASAICFTFAARASDTTAPEITHSPASLAAPGQAIRVTARIVDESRIFPQLFFRYGSKGTFEPPLDLKHMKDSKDQYETSIPYKPGPIDYYLECYDEFGNGPARAGTGDNPLHVLGTLPGGPSSDSNSLPLPTFAAEDHPAPRSIAAPVVSSPAPVNEAPVRVAAMPESPAPIESAPATTNSSSPALTLQLAQPAQPWTRQEAAWHSLILPGWGQYRTERRARGIAFGVATGVSLVATVWLAVRAQQANDVYENAPVSVRSQAYVQATNYAHARNAMLAVTAGLWALNVVEAFFRYGNKDPW